MATTNRPNPHKQARQQDKAYRISRLIWSRLTQEHRIDPALPAAVAKMTEGERLGWALEAQVPPLSDESWALLVSMLADKVADERHWLSIEAAS